MQVKGMAWQGGNFDYDLWAKMTKYGCMRAIEFYFVFSTSLW